MKTVNNIERWLSDVETRLVPPERPLLVLQVLVYEARDKEKALAGLAALYPDRFAGRTVEDFDWSDDLAAVQAKALAEHMAAHPEDAGRTIRWMVRTIVTEPQEVELTAEEAGAEDKKIEDDIVVPADASAAVSETPPALNVLSFDCSARSKPWRPVHQRPARDMRRPTWKKWER
jgi:hypothetical protein